MISKLILSTMVGSFFGLVVGGLLGGPLIRWSEDRDRRAGGEPIGRGCLGIILTGVLVAIAFGVGFYMNWNGL